MNISLFEVEKLWLVHINRSITGHFIIAHIRLCFMEIIATWASFEVKSVISGCWVRDLPKRVLKFGLELWAFHFWNYFPSFINVWPKIVLIIGFELFHFSNFWTFFSHRSNWLFVYWFESWGFNHFEFSLYVRKLINIIFEFDSVLIHELILIKILSFTTDVLHFILFNNI